jgi:hypothetical protein
LDNEYLGVDNTWYPADVLLFLLSDMTQNLSRKWLDPDDAGMMIYDPLMIDDVEH